MQDTLLAIAERLTDDELLHRVRLLARREREATVELVAHLVELEARRLHLAEGYGSLFGYCTEVLRLAEHAAYNRIEAARAIRKFPVVLDRLANGSVNLSTLRLLAPHLTAENHLRVLEAAANKSKREVEVLVARLAPRPDAPAFVRKLPQPRLLSQAPAAAPALATPATADVATTQAAAHAPAPAASAIGEDATEPPSVASTGADAGAVALVSRCPSDRSPHSPVEPGAQAVTRPDLLACQPAPTVIVPAPAAPPATRPVIAPLSPGRYRVQFTVGPETHENLRRAQELLRREVPDGDPGAIFDLALKLLLEDVARKSSPRRRSHVRSEPQPPDPGTSRLTSGVPSGYGMPASVPSSQRPADAAASARSWSSITWIRTRSAERPTSRTSPCAAAHTTSTRPSDCSGCSCRSCGENVRPGGDRPGSLTRPGAS